jgi:hypothetical protein
MLADLIGMIAPGQEYVTEKLGNGKLTFTP